MSGAGWACARRPLAAAARATAAATRSEWLTVGVRELSDGSGRHAEEGPCARRANSKIPGARILIASFQNEPIKMHEDLRKTKR